MQNIGEQLKFTSDVYSTYNYTCKIILNTSNKKSRNIPYLYHNTGIFDLENAPYDMITTPYPHTKQNTSEPKTILDIYWILMLHSGTSIKITMLC